MNRYKLYKAGVDTNEGINRFGGKIELYEKYLYEFPSDQSFQALCDAIQSKDVKAAFSAAHALKGVAGNLSLKTLYMDIAPFVETLRGGSLEHSEEALKTVTADYMEVIAALRVQE